MCEKRFEYFMSLLKSDVLGFYIHLGQEQVNLNFKIAKFGLRAQNIRFCEGSKLGYACFNPW